MDEPHVVNDATHRLALTRGELAQIEALLSELPARKAALLGAPELDERSLSKLEIEEAVLSRKHDTLQARVPILAAQVEHEHARTAQARITQLIEESADLRSQQEELLRAFHQAAETLRRAAEKLVAGTLRLQGAHDEQAYYVERYAGFHLTRAALSDPVAPVPDEQSVAKSTLSPLKEYWQRSQMVSGMTEWSRRLSRLQDEQWASRQRDVRPHVREHV